MNSSLLELTWYTVWNPDEGLTLLFFSLGFVVFSFSFLISISWLAESLKGYVVLIGSLLTSSLLTGTVLFLVTMFFNSFLYTRYTEQEFNREVIQNVEYFKGKATCKKNGILLEGTYESEMRLNRTEIVGVNVPISGYVHRDGTCLLGWYYPSERVVVRYLEMTAEKYIALNKTAIRNAEREKNSFEPNYSLQ